MGEIKFTNICKNMGLRIHVLSVLYGELSEIYYFLCRLTSFTYEEAKAAELDHREKVNSAITTAFLELMVNLFRLVNLI